MGAFRDATLQYYHEGNWTITEIRNELIMQGMSSAEAKKDIAAHLKVTVRSVERYLQQEAGSSKQARGKKALIAKQAQINALGDELIGPPEEGGEIELHIKGKIKVRSSKKKKQDDERERDFSLTIDANEWSKLVRLANAKEGGERQAQEYVFKDLYGVSGMTLVRGSVTVS